MAYEEGASTPEDVSDEQYGIYRKYFDIYGVDSEEVSDFSNLVWDVKNSLTSLKRDDYSLVYGKVEEHIGSYPSIASTVILNDIAMLVYEGKEEEVTQKLDCSQDEFCQQEDGPVNTGVILFDDDNPEVTKRRGYVNSGLDRFEKLASHSSGVISENSGFVGWAFNKERSIAKDLRKKLEKALGDIFENDGNYASALVDFEEHFKPEPPESKNTTIALNMDPKEIRDAEDPIIKHIKKIRGVVNRVRRMGVLDGYQHKLVESCRAIMGIIEGRVGKLKDGPQEKERWKTLLLELRKSSSNVVSELRMTDADYFLDEEESEGFDPSDEDFDHDLFPSEIEVGGEEPQYVRKCREELAEIYGRYPVFKAYLESFFQTVLKDLDRLYFDEYPSNSYGKNFYGLIEERYFERNLHIYFELHDIKRLILCEYTLHRGNIDLEPTCCVDFES